MDKFVKIKKKYISTFPKKLLDLTLAWEKKEIDVLHDLLHKLSGSSGSYGFDKLCLISRTATNLTLDYNPINVDKVDDCLRQIFIIFEKEGFAQKS